MAYVPHTSGQGGDWALPDSADKKEKNHIVKLAALGELVMQLHRAKSHDEAIKLERLIFNMKCDLAKYPLL